MLRKMSKACLALLMAVLLASAPVTALAKAKTVNILVVTGDYVRLRSEPSAATGDVVTTLGKGSKVFMLTYNKGWVYLRTSRGKMGYMYKDYLKFYGAAKLNSIYFVSSSSLKLYKKASTSAGRVTTLPRWEHVIVYATSGKWAYVKTLSGKGGFALRSGLTKAT